MGYNSTVVVMNDSLDAIANDPDFGKKLANAIRRMGNVVDKEESIDVSAFGHVNAATVIETHHADMTTLVAVGGNYGNSLGTAWGYTHHKEEDKIGILKQIVDQYGFSLAKKRKK